MAHYRTSVVYAVFGMVVSVGLFLTSTRQACGAVSQIIGTARGTSYMLFDHFGGTWYDTEKSPLTDQDDSLCWAAAASNALQWSGWGQASGLTTSDQIFQYFQDHWTNQGGSANYALQWWFSGQDNAPQFAGWAHVDVAGGGFYPNTDLNTYYREHTSPYYNDMDSVKSYLRSGSCVMLMIYNNDESAHFITCWGYSYDPKSGQYNGVWVTDSDDNKSDPNAPDTLRYYDVAYSNYTWHLQDYYGTDNWYLGEVEALSAPEPTTLALLSLGWLGVMRRRRSYV